METVCEGPGLWRLPQESCFLWGGKKTHVHSADTCQSVCAFPSPSWSHQQPSSDSTSMPLNAEPCLNTPACWGEQEMDQNLSQGSCCWDLTNVGWVTRRITGLGEMAQPQGKSRWEKWRTSLRQRHHQEYKQWQREMLAPELDQGWGDEHPTTSQTSHPKLLSLCA